MVKCDYKEYGIDMKISIVILYTADVMETNVQNIVDIGSVKMKLEQAFLFRF